MALEALGHRNLRRISRSSRSETEKIEGDGSVIVFPAIVLLQEPDSLCRDPSECRVRGRARGPYDWHPIKRELEGRRALRQSDV
eukprot:592804-Heterocapsa_arctica.AAC.1